MTAGELAIVLTHVDPRIDVHVAAPLCVHVNQVQLKTRRRMWRDPVLYPPALILRGSTFWFDDAPVFEMSGRFLNQAELEDQLP